MATAADFSETFDSDMGKYSFGFGYGAWTGSYGFPSVGSARTASPNQGTADQMECTPGTAYIIQAGDSMWFAYRIIGADVLSGASDVLNIAFFNITNPGFSLSFDDITVADTGWIIKEIDLSDSVGDNLSSVFCTGYGPCNVYFDTISFSSTSPFPSASEYLLRNFDIEAGNNQLYIGVVGTDGFPRILRMSALLDENPSQVFNPGAGSEVFVKCGRQQDNKVWAVGDFGSSTVVRYSETEYWYSDTESDSWYPPARSLFVGPNNDNLALVSVPNDDKLYQSYFVGDTGPYWFNLSYDNDLPFDVNAITRLDVNLAEIMIGAGVSSDAYWYPYWTYVDYSPDYGYDFIDISGSLSSLTGAVTDLIYGTY